MKPTDAHRTVTAVVAGFLHDVLEDSNAAAVVLEREVGQRVVKLVKCNSYDPSISKSEQAYEELFRRAAACGRDALVIKAADLLDNSAYYCIGVSED